MSKLAAMRTTTPAVTAKAEDTVTRLMRGLFGNLLTIAGSGVRPLSMVWQLFGSGTRLEIPTTEIEWTWYETVAQLYPYTGWPIEQFHDNLEQLLSKALIRAVTKNENTVKIKLDRTAMMIEYCRLRNIQLQHSRTIITVLMRMLTTEGSNMTAISSRLLSHLPEKLQRQTEGYTRMIRSLQHLATGGHQRVEDNLVAVSVYTRRSAGFAAFKTKVAEACESREWAKAKDFSQALLDHHVQIASLWHVEPDSFKFQNFKAYQELLSADLRDDVDQETKNKNTRLIKKITGDAERTRIPWQIGKEGGLSTEIEPLDEALLHELLTGEKIEIHEIVPLNHEPKSATESIVVPLRKPEDDFDPFKSSLSAKFVTEMQQDLTAEDVCGIINVSVPAMRVFVTALNPDFVWEDLGKNFRGVVLGLLQERSGREESRPARKLLNLGGRSITLKVDGQHGD
ncbi:hypothetical protein S7711_04125 [Stachybotrys chartarum IBT 7711]|uniref:Uncharacterized protein n=1 Tax=Stachybotrys chartarum (strain CBS 109288 / IBT 7711) TaxID=1280523 RepID=A0A084AR86_STACB|nr:hypothetical protein S7711_04125 [Stachybotrys chartarum IBT 7711]